MIFFGFGCGSKKISGHVVDTNNNAKPTNNINTFRPRPPKASVLGPAIRKKEILAPINETCEICKW